MREVATAEGILRIARDAHKAEQRVGLVPTMGYLHAGHLALVQAARAETDTVILSVFVNPAQFGPQEDLARYPRDLERDVALANDAGVDIMFVPGEAVMYPHGVREQRVWVDPGDLASDLCGATRPRHFRAVATVVAKLFNLVQPNVSYFGQKDAQQAAIIAQMATDLCFPVTVRIVPTVRDSDGLALSSRNALLSLEERSQAVALSRALCAAGAAVEAGEREPRVIEAGMRRLIQTEAPDARLDYATIADLKTMRAAEGSIQRDALIALAVHLGPTRLIDNGVLRFSAGVPKFSMGAPAENGA